MLKPTLSRLGILVAFSLTAAIYSSAQTKFTTVRTFQGTDGAFPEASLVQGSDGNFYGTTSAGGTSSNCTLSQGCGTIFQVTSAGVFTTIYNFCSKASCADGVAPQAGLIQGSDGSLYGTTMSGGTHNTCSNGCGTIFRITTSGVLTNIYDFCSLSNCTDGAYPLAALTQGTDGNFYGTTVTGGANNNCFYSGGENGCGTAFRINSHGSLVTLYNFCSQASCTDGEWPYAALLQASDGNFYGTTIQGGANELVNGCTTDCGTIFRLTSAGSLTTIYSFCSLLKCADGSGPWSGLIQGDDGELYGTTVDGGTGTSTHCQGCGTIFKISLAGSFTTLYDFCSLQQLQKCLDGQLPTAGLVQARNGNFYGTTEYGGTHCEIGESGCGTIFYITPSGDFTVLYDFCAKQLCPDGMIPVGGLIQGSDGSFYGTTRDLSVGTYGTIFQLSGSTLTPSLIFPAKKVGTTSSPKRLVFANKEGTTITGITITVTGDFAISSTTCSDTLANKTSCQIEVTFTPTQTGLRTGQVKIVDSASNTPQTASLTGTGK